MISLFCLVLLLQPIVSFGGNGNPVCWSSGFSYDECCHSRHGKKGNAACFDGIYTYEECCFEDGSQEGDGITTVLNECMKECSGVDFDALPSPLRCRGTSTVSGSEWEELFRLHRLSQVFGGSMQGWPNVTDLFVRANRSITDTKSDCIFGFITAMLHSLPSIENKVGLAYARHVFAQSKQFRGSVASLADTDCRWNRMTNHALYAHYPQLLGSDARFTDRCPDGAPHIFVYDTGAIADLPLSCARTGFWASDVYVDRFFRHSPCRVQEPEQADFFFIPAYLTCWELQKVRGFSPQEISNAAKALSQEIRGLPHWHRRGGADHVFLFGASAWQLEGWRQILFSSVILAVESRPIECTNETAEICYHCTDCFQPWKDLVIPPVTPSLQARLLLQSSVPVETRTLIMSWHGQHANSSDVQVQKAYRSTNESVRLSLLRLAGRPNVSIGGPVSGYSAVMGNSQFCLCPKGASSYTSRVFEALYAGCIPVILSDDVRLPFDTIVDWGNFSIRWPMHGDVEALHRYLRRLLHERPAEVLAMQQEVARIRCWFDYFGLEEDPLRCSPYVAILRGLAERKRVMPRSSFTVESVSASHDDLADEWKRVRSVAIARTKR